MLNKKLKKKDGATFKGVYKFTKAKLETKEQFNLSAKIDQFRKAGKDISALVNKLNSICKTEVIVLENLIPTVGRTMVANQIAPASGTPDNDPVANYIGYGTGTNAPANGDTTLQTEVYRNTVASRTNSNNIGYITGFLNATEDDDTYREAGIFCDGGAGADTGILLSRIAINITKSNTETLTIDWTLTIS